MGGRLQGRVAIVTGGSRGIGAAIAHAFAREGARVVISSRKQEGLDAAAGAMNAAFPGAVRARACHVGDPAALGELVSWVAAEVGLPDVLVNNAATNPYFGPMLGVSRAAWDKTFEVNLRGPFEATRLVVQRLLEAGRPGSIINVASVVGLAAAPLQGIYGMTKAALISMTRTLAFELGRTGIRVNAIAPGLVDTRLASAIIENSERVKVFTDRTAVGRYAQPEEIAHLAVFLASDESGYVTGQTYCVDGGYSIS
jgi:NAD(P)-dependent dehydrogenase (short-subunit alcohol dehydrogenase family)